MRRIALFISRFALGFFILSVWSFCLLMVSVAPGLIDDGIVGVSFAMQDKMYQVNISGRKFSCAGDIKDLLQCQVMIEGHPLEMAVTYDESRKSTSDLRGCRATYAGKSMNCGIGDHYSVP